MRQRGLQYAAWIVVGTLEMLCRTASADDFQYVSAFALDPVQTQPLTVVVPGAIVCTNADDVVMAGHFAGQTDFDPGPGTANITSSSNGANGFLLKFDSDQQYLWSAAFISSLQSYATDVDVDFSENILVSGEYTGTVDLDPGASTTNASSAGDSDIFVAKLDSNGNHLWSASFGGLASDSAQAIASDSLGNVYVAGTVQSPSVDFDPGPGSVNSSGAGIFVLKLDSAGNFVWMRHISSASGGATDLLIDSNGDMVVAGGFEDSADFDPGAGVTTLTSVGNGSDPFLLKMDAAGAFLWAKSFGGSSNDRVVDLVETGAGNLLLAGEFNLTVDFDPGLGTETRVAVGDDGYVLKLGSDGSFGWVYTLGSNENDNAWALDTDSEGNVMVTGDFSATVDFDPGPASHAMVASSASDGYILQLDPNGDFLAVRPIRGPGYETPLQLRIDSTDRVHLAGRLYDSADLDPGPAVTIFSSTHNGDGAYVLALDLVPIAPLPVSAAWALTALCLLLVLAASLRFVRHRRLDRLDIH